MKKFLLGLVVFAATALGLAAPAHAEPLNHCPGIRAAVAGGETTCMFAANVWRAWFGTPGWGPVNVYSPVTGGVYTMMCTKGFNLTFDTGEWVTGATRCVDAEGGSAIAYVW